jgi:hypothetical protein
MIDGRFPRTAPASENNKRDSAGDEHTFSKQQCWVQLGSANWTGWASRATRTWTARARAARTWTARTRTTRTWTTRTWTSPSAAGTCNQHCNASSNGQNADRSSK